MIKFIHLLITTTLLGLQVANYYYLATSLQQSSVKLVQYTLRLTLAIDIALAVIISSTFLTCTYLVLHLPNFSFQIPWVHVACALLSVVTLFWLTIVLLKLRKLSAIKKNRFQRSSGLWWIHLSYLIIIVLLALIIHDAVMRSTLLPGFL